MDWLAVLAVIGTLVGVGLGGIITYQTQKRLQESQRELDLNKQKREMRREQLLAISSKLIIIETQFFNEEMIASLTEDEKEEAKKVVAKAGIELYAAIDDPNLLILTRDYLTTSEQKERIDTHRQIQSLIRDEIDKTFDPNFSVKTASSSD